MGKRLRLEDGREQEQGGWPPAGTAVKITVDLSRSKCVYCVRSQGAEQLRLSAAGEIRHVQHGLRQGLHVLKPLRQALRDAFCCRSRCRSQIVDREPALNQCRLTRPSGPRTARTHPCAGGIVTLWMRPLSMGANHWRPRADKVDANATLVHWHDAVRARSLGQR